MSAVAILLVATVSTGDLQAKQGDIFAYFRNFNPTARYPQFRGVKINILYSCVEATEISERDTCRRVKDLVSSQDDVIYIHRKHLNLLALNFFVAEALFPKEEIAVAFDGCSLRLRGSSVVVLKPGANQETLEKCILSSTLIHLGFFVNDVIHQGMDASAFRRIVSSYTLDQRSFEHLPNIESK